MIDTGTLILALLAGGLLVTIVLTLTVTSGYGWENKKNGECTPKKERKKK